jgi:hypothetical protein
MKALLLPAVAALMGAGALALLAGRLHPARKWGYRFDRGQAISLAKVQAGALGVPADGWDALVNPDIDTELEYYKLRHPDDGAARLLSPYIVKVVLVSPLGQRSISIQLARDGRVASWERKEAASKDWTMRSMRSAVDAAFHQIAGPDASRYYPVTEGAATKEGLRFTWERANSAAAFQPTIDIIVQDGAVVHAETHYSFSKQFDSEYDRRGESMDWFQLAYGAFYFVLALAAVGQYAVGSIRRKVNQRFALTAAVVNLVSLLLAFWFGSQLENIRSIGILSSSDLYFGARLAAGYELATALLLALVAAGGGLFAAGSLRPKWRSLRLLFSRLAWSKQVGRSVGTGVLVAPLLAAMPLLTNAVFPAAFWGVRGKIQLFSPHPILETFGYLMHPTELVFFGVLVGLIWNRVHANNVRWAVAAVPATLFFIGFHDFIHGPTMAVLLAGALMAVAQIWLFLRCDLLTLLVAETSLPIINLAVGSLLQPSASLQSIGGQSLAVLGALLGAGLVVLWKAPDVAGEEVTTSEPLNLQSEREELKAEFLVAQRAQREMLPALPPNVAGFSLAASCTPAREVGGDLYDFLPLSNDRLAIAVADVSGKGVPAALYMTLTKGLLAATTQDDLDLASILEQINAHLCTVGQRKTFVTMALGILDPGTRSLEYARAGHNPAVWRRRALGTTSLLNTKGLGLGITPGRVFGRTLAVEKLDLETGDTLVFYSDGLTEAMNVELEQFGEERLMEVVGRLDGLTAAGARDAILDEVGRFLDGVRPQDDLTLVVLRVD